MSIGVLIFFAILGAFICAKSRVAGGAVVFSLIALVLFIGTPVGSGLPAMVGDVLNSVSKASQPLTGSAGSGPWDDRADRDRHGRGWRGGGLAGPGGVHGRRSRAVLPDRRGRARAGSTGGRGQGGVRGLPGPGAVPLLGDVGASTRCCRRADRGRAPRSRHRPDH